MTIEAPLVVDDLTVAYRDKRVLQDVDLEIPPGKLVAIIGPNGAGKSTLIKAVLDLVPRVAGSVRVFGRPYREGRKLVAYVPQRNTVDWDFPTDALDVVTMALRPFGLAATPWAGGTRPRAAVARAGRHG